MKDGPPTFQKIMIKTFREYLKTFMNIYVDDFTIYSDMQTHLQKFKLCFQKCKEYNISLNSKKCTFMVFSRVIFGFIISKEGNLLDPKKIQAIVNMPIPQNSQHIQIFNGMAQFYICYIKNFVVIMVPIMKLTRKTKSFMWIKECQKAWELTLIQKCNVVH